MEAKAARFALIREAMPGTARLIAVYRRQLGDAFVTECIKRGLAGEPGWFFAREGTLALGTPFPTDDATLTNFAAAWVTTTQALVMLRNPSEADRGAH
jgi:hypothetical protein